jgi:hypothetical protein
MGEARDKNGVLQQGQLTERGKVPRESCASCGAERPCITPEVRSAMQKGVEMIFGCDLPVEVLAGLALIDGERTLLRKKIEALEASERAYKAEISALEVRVTELQARGTELVLERQAMREGIARELEESGARADQNRCSPETGACLRLSAERVRSCKWDKPLR